MRWRSLALAASVVAIGFAMVATLPAAQRGRDVQRGRGRGGRPAEPDPLLAAAVALKCSFTTSAVANWNGDDPEVQVQKPAPVLTVVLTDIDGAEGTGESSVGGGSAAP